MSSSSPELQHSGAPAIVLRGVSKEYPVLQTFADYARHLRRDPRAKRVTALHDLSLEVRPGEVVGLIGRNGAGKSTVLRVAAGVTRPTRGTVSVTGAVFPLLDLSAGMSPLLSGRENAFRRGVLLGLSRRAVLDRMDEMIDFAGLWDAIDDPVFTYSAGMKVRLAFASATVTDPDILLVDEILAVGDEFFAAKSFGRLRQLAAAGGATLVASHDWFKTFRLCDRIVWLEAGRIKAEGPPDAIMYDYLDALNAYQITGEIRITTVDVLDEQGCPIREVESGSTVTLRVAYEADPGTGPFAVVTGWMDASTGEGILSSWSVDDGFQVLNPARSGVLEIHYPALPLAAGEYDASVFFSDPGQGPFPISYYADWWHGGGRGARITVVPENLGRPGMLHFPVRWTLETREQSLTAVSRS